jgi:undecaprenyl-diphosphatase
MTLPFRTLLSRRNVIIAILLLTGLALFLSTYDGVQEKGDLASFDAPVLAWVLAHQNPQLTVVMQIITDLLSPVGLSVLTLVAAVIWAWRKKDFWRPSLLVGAMLFAYIISAIIKAYTARARPTITDLLASPTAISYSFPSGHTIGVAVLLLVLSYFVCANTPTFRRVATWALISSAGVLVVAFSRVYLGYHWLTDVTASVGLAIVILAMTITIDTFATQYRRTTSSKVISDTDQ